MDFSVVECGYDRREVDAGLADLADRLARMTARATAAAGAGPEAGLAVVREEIATLTALLRGRSGSVCPPSHRMQRLLAAAEKEAADLLGRARAELAAAEQEAARIRDVAYAEALRARRDFETALEARRLRAERTDAILAAIVPPPTAPPPVMPSPPVMSPAVAVAAAAVPVAPADRRRADAH